MEEASANGDLDLVTESFASVILSSDRSIPLLNRILPGAKEVIERSACLAAKHGHISIFSFLLDQGAPFTANVLASAFCTNKVEFCQALTENGWLPQPGEVPLMSVLSSEIALRWVLEHGWNPNLISPYEIHPLTIAARSFPPSVVKILLEHGVGARGTMAMHAAAGMAAEDPTRFEVLDLLLLYDADIDEMEADPEARKPWRERTTGTGRPLHHAVRANSIETVKYLMEKGASPWAPGWSGEGALKVAERCNQVEIAETIRRLSPPEYSSLSFP